MPGGILSNVLLGATHPDRIIKIEKYTNPTIILFTIENAFKLNNNESKFTRFYSINFTLGQCWFLC